MCPYGAQHDAVVVYRYRLAPTSGFEYVSPSCRTLIGYTPEDHYADPLLGFKVIHPEDAPLLVSLMRSPDTLDRPLVLRLRRKDGAVVWTEVHNEPTYDAAGNCVLVEGIALDVTRRERGRPSAAGQAAVRFVERVRGGAPGELLQGAIEELGPVVLLRMEGEIDISTAPTLEAYLRLAMERGRPMIVDLTRVAYFDASGIRALEGAARDCAARDTPFVIVPSRVVRRVLELVELDQDIAMAESTAAAMRLVSEPRSS